MANLSTHGFDLLKLEFRNWNRDLNNWSSYQFVDFRGIQNRQRNLFKWYVDHIMEYFILKLETNYYYMMILLSCGIIEFWKGGLPLLIFFIFDRGSFIKKYIYEHLLRWIFFINIDFILLIFYIILHIFCCLFFTLF